MPQLPPKLSALMRRRYAVVAAVVVVLVAGGLWFALAHTGGHKYKTKPPVQAQPPTQGAPQGVDLSGWKLTLPEGDEDGKVTQIDPAAPTQPWMVPDGKGGFAFWAPSSGTTTKHSDHPRTELNSLTNFKSGQGVHELRAAVTVQQEPQDGQGIIVGQIHGADDISSVPYVMVRYQDHGLIAVVKQVQDGNDHVNYQLLKDLPLNTPFDFTITDQGNGNLGFTANAGTQHSQQVVPIPAEFKGATVRFQAGDYQQADDPAGGQDGGRVVFHGLQQSTTSP